MLPVRNPDMIIIQRIVIGRALIYGFQITDPNIYLLFRMSFSVARFKIRISIYSLVEELIHIMIIMFYQALFT